MGVVLNVDPSTVNVMTDLFLLVMQFAWIWLMDGLYKLHLKRKLRLGERIYSYEPFGTLARFRLGASKVEAMRKQELLESRERKRFRFEGFVAVMSFLFANLVLALHVLIDQGLDFQRTDPTLATEAKIYDMMEVFPDNSFAENLAAYTNLGAAVKTCIETERNIQMCRRDADVFKESLLANTMNSIAFGRSLFESSSITDMDMVEWFDFQYITYVGFDPAFSNETKGLCQVKSGTNLDDYYGSMELEPEKLCNARLRRGLGRAISIDLRATQVETSFPIGTQTGRIARLGGLEIVKTDKMIAYRQFKDEYQVPSKVSIIPHKGFVNEQQSRRGVRLSVDSRVVYDDQQKQTVLVADLSRSLNGMPYDELFAVDLHTFTLSRNADQEEVLCPQEMKGREGIANLRMEEKLSMLYDGTFCGEFTFHGVLNVCTHQNRTYDQEIGSGTNRTQVLGFQVAEMNLLMDEANECRQFAEKLYAEQIPSHKKNAPFALLMSLHLDIVCTTNADPLKINCALGGKKLFWSPERGFTDVFSSVNGRQLKRLKRHRNRVGWALLQIEGGDVEATAGAFKVIQQFLQDHYPTFRVLVSRGVSRGDFLSHTMYFGVRDTLFALSTQLRAAGRNVREYRAKDVAVLNVTYFLGLALAVTINVAAGCIMAIRYWQEQRAYRNIDLDPTVPSSITEWINQAISCNSKFPHQKGFDITHQCEIQLGGEDPGRDDGKSFRKKPGQEGFLTFSDQSKSESKQGVIGEENSRP